MNVESTSMDKKIDSSGRVAVYMKISKSLDDFFATLARKGNTTKTQIFTDWLESLVPKKRGLK
jgi:hypothetical protein